MPVVNEKRGNFKGNNEMIRAAKETKSKPGRYGYPC
jgi:hypothetical protein